MYVTCVENVSGGEHCLVIDVSCLPKPDILRVCTLHVQIELVRYNMDIDRNAFTDITQFKFPYLFYVIHIDHQSALRIIIYAILSALHKTFANSDNSGVKVNLKDMRLSVDLNVHISCVILHTQKHKLALYLYKCFEKLLNPYKTVNMLTLTIHCLNILW